MASETDFSDPLEFGDRMRIVLRNVEGQPDIPVWNLSGRPIRARGNRGEGDIYLRSTIGSPSVIADGVVSNKELLEPYSYGDGAAWAIVSPEVASRLRREPHGSRLIAPTADRAGLPILIDGKSVATELYLLGLRLWTVKHPDELAALGVVDFAATDPVAVQV